MSGIMMKKTFRNEVSKTLDMDHYPMVFVLLYKENNQ